MLIYGSLTLEFETGF